jgi:hypothetical protein
MCGVFDLGDHQQIEGALQKVGVDCVLKDKLIEIKQTVHVFLKNKAMEKAQNAPKR